MSKRKIVLLALAVCMVAILAVGGTLAYFTAEDDATNTFTVGNVAIDLEETFEQNSELAPGLKINKDAWVVNTGSKPAYVRVHIAIPFDMDDGDPSFNASHNFLHWNFPGASMVDGKWSFLPENSTGTGYKGNGVGNWNYYTTEIEGEKYAVYVATYRSPVPAGGQTEIILDQVYLDKTVNCKTEQNDDGSVTYVYTDTHGNEVRLSADQAKNIQIHIVAEATQTDTFTDAYQALNTAFGVPGTYNPWAN